MATPIILPVTAIPRNQGVQVPACLPASRWIDAKVLAAGVAETYAPPSDADDTPGVIIGINATDGPLYINFNGVAAVPIADIADGTASAMLRTDTGSPFLIAWPDRALSLSMISPVDCTVTIEVWR